MRIVAVITWASVVGRVVGHPGSTRVLKAKEPYMDDLAVRVSKKPTRDWPSHAITSCSTKSSRSRTRIAPGNRQASIGGLPLSPDWVFQGIADFNKDGTADILWRQSSRGAMATWLMKSAAIQSIVQGYPVATSDWTMQGLGDFDGVPDTLWRQTSTTLGLWLLTTRVQARSVKALCERARDSGPGLEGPGRGGSGRERLRRHPLAT